MRGRGTTSFPGPSRFGLPSPSVKQRRRSKAALLGSVAALLCKVVVSAVALSIPVLGVWCGSSLAAFRGDSLWVPLAAGLVAFPVLPLLWDGLAEWRRRSQQISRERFLTFWDRLILRTIALNLAFLSALLAAQPEAAFTALSTRGDWMLRGRGGAAVETTRRTLFAAAAGLEWLYEAAHEDEFARLAPDDANETPDDLRPGSLPGDDGAGRPQDAGASESRPEDTGGAGAPDAGGPEPAADGEAHLTTDQPKPEPAPPDPMPRWPLSEELHPAVKTMPREEEESIESVARYIAEREPNPYWRVKALHDWVADRIGYDAPALAARTYPSQDAVDVFHSRVAVCAGYARLMVALGRAIGERVAYLTGDARTDVDEVGGGGHAWNAVQIEGEWYLLDATWDAGSVKGAVFTKRYGTEYLLTPPEIFGVDHFPEEPKWQLRAEPLSRGDFMRQPMLRPAFSARGFRLLQPQRSQVTVSGTLQVVVDNPLGQYLMAHVAPRDDRAEDYDCSVDGRDQLRIDCRMPYPGVFRMSLFANDQPFGSFESVGSFDAVNR